MKESNNKKIKDKSLKVSKNNIFRIKSKKTNNSKLEKINIQVKSIKEQDHIDYSIPEHKEAITISEAKDNVVVDTSHKRHTLRQKRYISVQNKLLPFWKQVTFIIILSIALTFVMDYFVNPSGLFSIGASSLAQGFAYMAEAIIGAGGSDVVPQVFWLVFGIINLPILIFAYFKFSNRFVMLTTIAIVVSITSSFIMKEIPGLTDPTFIFEAISGKDEKNDNITRIIIGTAGGIMYGILVGLTLKFGGSTGGTDPIARYLSKTKALNVGSFNIAISSFIMITFLLINDFGLSGNSKNAEQFFLTILGSKTMGSILFIFIGGLTLDNIYPTKKTLLIVIDSEKGNEISKNLISESWTRGHTISKMTAQSKTKGIDKYSISIVINSRELQDLLYFIKDLDQEAFITASPITGVYGNFDERSKIE